MPIRFGVSMKLSRPRYFATRPRPSRQLLPGGGVLLVLLPVCFPDLGRLPDFRPSSFRKPAKQAISQDNAEPDLQDNSEVLTKHRGAEELANLEPE